MSAELWPRIAAVQGSSGLTLVEAAQLYARTYGYTVRRGTWVYSATGRPICEGWEALGDMLRLRGWVRGGRVLWETIPASAWDRVRP